MTTDRRGVSWSTWWLAAVAVAALGAPWFAPADPAAVSLEQALLPPSAHHWLGTDQLGRDLCSRMIYGAQISLLVGLTAVSVSTIVGTVIGAVAGYAGGLTDLALMRATDVMLCFPTLFLILAVVSFLEPNIFNIMIVIGLTSWMGVARLVRAEVLSLREREFVLAARVTGASSAWILRKHLLPNALGPILVNATFGVGSAMLIESGLSFLGLGVQPPAASWGNILTEGKETLGVAWWLTAWPGVAIFLTVLACHHLGERLRDRWRQPV